MTPSEIAPLEARADPATNAAFDALRCEREAPADNWPKLDDTALYGLAGTIVAELLPETEADPVALLFTVLTASGAAMGRESHAVVGGAEHPARLFVVLVGQTSVARKGTSWAESRRVLTVADDDFVGAHILGGFGSGEALIDAAAEGNGRLLIIEPEFARVLAVCRREGSVLSAIWRAMYDGERLELRTRKATAVADGAHISVLAHVTVEELRAKLDETEQANGFANRHLFPLVRRSKLLPSGGNLDDSIPDALGTKLMPVLKAAREGGVIRRTPEAEDTWRQIYYRLAEDEGGGLAGAITARSAAQCLRLSVTYALLDRSRLIEPVHVKAAEAAWQYCADSARYIFGDVLGNPVADKLLDLVSRAGPGGLDLTERYRAFSGNLSAARLDRATERLVSEGRIAKRTEEAGASGGRPRTVLVSREHLTAGSAVTH